MTLNSRVAAYLPTIVRRHLETRDELLVPATHSVKVVAMFADVAGFTAMTESLAVRGGSLGAESLGKHLNAYFQQLVRFVTGAGGDVFKFAGDAMIVLWPENKEDTIEALIRRCIQCGLGIQEKLHQAQLAPDVVLSIKIGIGVGRATVVHLGGESDGATPRMEYVGVGPALIQAFTAEHHALAGDVICSQECWSLVSSHFEAQEKIHGFYQIQSVLQPVKVCNRRTSITRDDLQLQNHMRQYVSRAVWPYLVADEETWGSELREVTVLFINLGFQENDLAEMHDTASVHALHTAFAAVQKCIYSYEGTINKFLVDDKGSTVIAVFGLPPVSHENDAVRGILAALAIRAALAPLGLKASVGIASGTAFCGIAGHHGNRREYTVLGDIVNLAARLMQKVKVEKGDSSIITDDRTKVCAQDVLHFEAAIEIFVKGKNDSIKIHRPYMRMSLMSHIITAKRSQTSSAPVTQLHVMQDMYKCQLQHAQRRLSRLADDVRPSIPEGPAAIAIQNQMLEKIDGISAFTVSGALLLEGDIGLGKSRLVRSTLASLPPQAATVVIASATPFVRDKPYAIFSDVLAKCMPPHCPDLQAFVLDCVTEGMAPNRTLLSHMYELNAILDVSFPQNEDADNNDDIDIPSFFSTLFESDVSSSTIPDVSLLEEAKDESERDSAWQPCALDMAGILLLTALHAISRRNPMVFCLDNAMYMDEKSWILTISLAKYFTNCVVIVVSRPPSLALTQHTASSSFRKQLRALKKLPSTVACVMERLTPMQTEALTKHILQIQVLDNELANLIISRAQGNPLFLSEILKDMHDQHSLRIQNHNASCSPVAQIAWADKKNTMYCFECHIELVDRFRCKQCGFVFCGRCTPRACYKKLQGGQNDTPVRHCRICYAITRNRRPSIERSVSASNCSSGSNSPFPEGKRNHRKVLSMVFSSPAKGTSPLKYRLALTPPRLIKAVLTTLLDQLTVPQCLLLKTASILVPPFDLKTLQAIYPVKNDHLLRDIDELERLLMLRPSDVFIGGLNTKSVTNHLRKYEFCHGFMGDVLRGLMLSPQLDKLYLKLADYRQAQEKLVRHQYLEKFQNKSKIEINPRLYAGTIHVKKQASLLRALNLGATEWKKRMALLHSNRLLLQSDHNMTGRYTTIELTGARVTECPNDGVKYACFQIEVQEWSRTSTSPQHNIAEAQPPRTFVVGVNTEDEVKHWVYMLKFAIESLQEVAA
ncbi:adenylate cyclase [Thraustotheca clavata]|uniref:Adenylate cyclase n=1 Tax=Thraustotheca clavata TaxID=74557 RepID=A0A1W0A4J0_9STRA|nr:adenylate cyclase [Thraustotheca clavata]